MKRILKYIIQIGPLMLLAFAVFILTRTPSDDRDWRFNLTEKASVTSLEAGQYDFQNVRAFEYAEPDHLTRQEWISTRVNVNDLKDVWFFLEPFPDSDKFGHTYLSFVFENASGQSQTLSISVEARKEKGEDYTAFNALFRKFELLYVWSTEKDVHSRIAVHRGHDIYAYQLNLTPDQAKAIFEHFITRTNALKSKPRFYNSLHSNCTGELAKAVNSAYPGALKFSRAWITTGLAPKWLHGQGYVVDPDQSFEQVHARSNIASRVRGVVNADTDAFPRSWRAEHHNADSN